MTYRRRKSTDINQDIYLVKDPNTGLYKEATKAQKIGKVKTGGKKKRDKRKTQKKRKYKKRGGKLVQATEEQKISKKSKERTFKLRKVNEPVLLTGDLADALSLATPPAVKAIAQVIAPPKEAPPLTLAEEEKIEEMAENNMEENMERKLAMVEKLMPNALPAAANQVQINRTAPVIAVPGNAVPGIAEPGIAVRNASPSSSELASSSDASSSDTGSSDTGSSGASSSVTSSSDPNVGFNSKPQLVSAPFIPAVQVEPTNVDNDSVKEMISAFEKKKNGTTVTAGNQSVFADLANVSQSGIVSTAQTNNTIRELNLGQTIGQTNGGKKTTIKKRKKKINKTVKKRKRKTHYRKKMHK